MLNQNPFLGAPWLEGFWILIESKCLQMECCSVLIVYNDREILKGTETTRTWKM